MENKIIEAVGIVIINKDKKVLIAKRKSGKPMANKLENTMKKRIKND